MSSITIFGIAIKLWVAFGFCFAVGILAGLVLAVIVEWSIYEWAVRGHERAPGAFPFADPLDEFDLLGWEAFGSIHDHQTSGRK